MSCKFIITGPPLETLKLVGWEVSGARLAEKESSTEVTAVLSPMPSSALVIADMKSRWPEELKRLATVSWEE